MLRFLDCIESLAEVPDEISLYIPLTGCQIRCAECNSKWLWEFTGDELSTDKLSQLIADHKGITCICIGGGHDYDALNELFNYIKHNTDIKTCWYTGLNYIPKSLDLNALDFIKIGPYISEYGGLDSRDTNQKFFSINHNNSNALENITFKFWKI